MKNNVRDLRDQFPRLMSQHQISFGAGPGWYDLVKSLLEAFAERRKSGAPDLKITQVKEKFGQLRVYFDGGDDEDLRLALEAEDQSAQICDVCGAKGDLMGPGWIRTRCPRHADDTLRVRIRTMADMVFQDFEKTDRWLQTPNPDFDGQAPLDVMLSIPGCERVLQYLRSLENPW